MKKLNKIPFAFSGVILAILALGNLLQSYHPVLRSICGWLALILFIIYTIRIFTGWQQLKEEWQQALPASVFPTYPMAIMLLATYTTPLLSIPLHISEFIWWFGLVFNILYAVYYIIKFALKRDMKLVFPSWGVVFCGYAVGAVTAPAFGQEAVGQILFCFALVGLVVVMPFMLYRVYGMKDLISAQLPTIMILAAPTSLLVAGYVNSFSEPNTLLLATLLILSQVIYWAVLLQAPKMMKSGFFPTYAGFTFPTVISALSLKLALPSLGWVSSVSSLLVTIETVVALVFVIYVLVEYIKFVLKED